MEAAGTAAAGTPVETAQTAVVVGGGISGLLAARTLARAGVRTTVLEASGVWGGCVGSHVVAGLTLDSGAESFATRSSAVADLAAELGLADSIVAPNPGGAWVQLPDGPRELPRTGVLGIPANPWDPEVRRSLGLAGSLRASFDKLLPASLGTTARGHQRLGAGPRPHGAARAGTARGTRRRRCPLRGPGRARHRHGGTGPPRRDQGPRVPRRRRRRPTQRAAPAQRGRAQRRGPARRRRPPGCRRRGPPSQDCAAGCTPSSPRCSPSCAAKA